MKKTICLLVAAVLSAVLAVPAAAEGPTTVHETVSLDGPHFLTGFCGFVIDHTGTLDVSVTIFPNGEELHRIAVDAELSANGRVAYESARFNVSVDPGSNTLVVTGTAVNIHAPGAGLLVQEAGRVARVLTTGEPVSTVGHLMLLEGQTDKVCSYFAGS
jgi:hypothetical protein